MGFDGRGRIFRINRMPSRTGGNLCQVIGHQTDWDVGELGEHGCRVDRGQSVDWVREDVTSELSTG